MEEIKMCWLSEDIQVWKCSTRPCFVFPLRNMKKDAINSIIRCFAILDKYLMLLLYCLIQLESITTWSLDGCNIFVCIIENKAKRIGFVRENSGMIGHTQKGPKICWWLQWSLLDPILSSCSQFTAAAPEQVTQETRNINGRNFMSQL